MLVRMMTSWLVMLAAVLVVGCSKPSASTSTTPAPAETTPAGEKQVVCHLDCSGNQAKGYGATEEEARADVRRHVEANCKPEDGQHFIFCEPAE